MPANSQTTKIVLLAVVIVVAIGAILFFAVGSGSTSGTIQETTKQMKPGVRSRRLPAQLNGQ